MALAPLGLPSSCRVTLLLCGVSHGAFEEGELLGQVWGGQRVWPHREAVGGAGGWSSCCPYLLPLDAISDGRDHVRMTTSLTWLLDISNNVIIENNMKVKIIKMQV